MVLGVEKVGNYKITNMGNGQYAVALTNGNMGAFVTDEKGLLEFKKKHNLETDTVEIANKTKELHKMTDEQKQEVAEKIRKIITERGHIDPRKDKIYFNPQTGELDTWKPGIRNPEDQDNNISGIGKLLGLTAMGAAGLIFRKPIGKVLSKVAGTVKPAIKALVQGSQGLISKIIKFFGKKAV